MDSILGYAGDEINPHGRMPWTRVVLRDFGAGHLEVSASKYETWGEPDPHADADEARKALRGESEDRERSNEVAARRARTKVRHRCKMMKARYMITLTTREVITDLDRFQRLYERFVRRVRQQQTFEYVAVPELQERGAIHLHIAVARKQDYKLLWSIWLCIVGLGEGRVHVTKGFSKHNTHRVACYLSKYLTKAFEDGALNKKRYWCSKGIAEPVKHVVLLPGGMDEADVYKAVAAMLIERGVRWSFADAVVGLGNCILWMHASPERHQWPASAVVCP